MDFPICASRTRVEHGLITGASFAWSAPLLVEYTWVSEATKGIESVVEVAFETTDGQTAVTLRHSGPPNDEMGRQHKDGWIWVLTMFAEQFPSKSS
jgi:hypothetical protein